MTNHLERSPGREVDAGGRIRSNIPVSISFDQVRVLNPSRNARRLLWHVLSIGVVSRDEAEEHAGMDKAGLFLFRVQSGRGKLELPGEGLALSRGNSWWLLDLAQSRRYVPLPGTSLVTMGVRFSGPSVDAWREAMFAERAGVVLSSKAHSTALRRTTNELMRLAQRPKSGGEWRTHELVMSVLGLFLQAQGLLEEKHADGNAPIRSVLEAVQANPARDWQATELSALAGISYSSLRTHFKATQGETLHEFLQRVRLEQARWRLSDMRLTVKEIARQLNFSSEFYFSRWFRQAAGMSPSKFRASVRG
jgi:AraC-like DNA-binding protein